MNGKIRPIENQPLHERAYRHIRGALMAGQFAPGEMVTLKRLAEALGTSVMPVRDAVRRLTSEGAFEALPHRALRVPEMTPARFQELSDVRALMEGEAAARAAARVDDQILAEIAGYNLALEKALEEGDLAAVTENNQRFHFAIYVAAEHHLMLTMIETLWLQAGPYIANLNIRAFRAGTAPDSFNDLAMRNHGKALDALKHGDAERAREGIQTDIYDSARYFRSIMEDTKPPLSAKG
jgi:DNA-binding GntR family transcriptional regulator